MVKCPGCGLRFSAISHKEELIKCFGNICSTHNGDGCGQKRKPRKLTIDHIIPKVLGGTGDITNKQLLCFSCHTKKNTFYNKLRDMAQIAPAIGSSALETVGTAPRTYQVHNTILSVI